MKMMSVEDLMDFWRETAYEILNNNNLSEGKEKRALFIEAYTSYLFYKEAYEEYYEEARQEADFELGISED